MSDVPLDRRSRWKIGGPAPRFAEASSEEELRMALAALEGESALVLGRGANLLIADEGPGAPVITLTGEFRSLELGEETFVFGAAFSIAALVQAARREARSGLWVLEAVPGTMGGALRLNAGTAEDWLWERMLWAEAMLEDGSIVRVTPSEVGPAYRAIDFDERAIFLRGEVAAPRGDVAAIEKEHMDRRVEKLAAQVYDKPTCGSTWKNPEGTSAWKLIDQVGMCGVVRGGAQISPKHANFIVNLGDAKADDVIELMTETRRRVFEETGILLAPEIHFWGFSTDRLRELGAAA